MTDHVEGAWRDEKKLPVDELTRAMASWDTDGQDDPSDNEYGRQPDDRDARPSTTGLTGPQ
ncbi:hypothetical protein ACWT_6456 [Actinoplanes sp. SE50]|uniref:hypothetical protein n=1 Tax=unclassified Actinoplanes TaxID=2626549 RepID=UPI00023EBFB9|nr:MULTISPECIES: hypothetical protein [unclassified Actinoplanes]AEV87469.1 hypothetical protein ACPL_6587 [Actinoplanes sp. SE50/110]ATO85871.1 hypothetical protein ACWT_6456 [Actinoplanes sp. SE50]SLM03285.1 hypothetical protein ACSP50_6574 [Actinoplanes sp. SE50/110]